MSQETILVTGAAGGTGSTARDAIAILLEQGRRVRAMVRRLDARADALRDLGADVVVADMLDIVAVRAAMRGCSVVYFTMSVSPVVATEDGVRAVEALIAEGLNINITLIFSLRHYEAVAAAYIRGLQRCASPAQVASVASFFVSRVDTQIDKALDANGSPGARALRGKIAIANAKAMYRRFHEIFYGEEFSTLRTRGARVQRPLWASTGTKNPNYSDVLYVEELIGPETVNTLPPNTLAAFRDHGQVRGDTVLVDWTEAEQELHALSSLGISLEAITDALQADGVRLFASAYDRVLNAIANKSQEASHVPSGA